MDRVRVRSLGSVGKRRWSIFHRRRSAATRPELSSIAFARRSRMDRREGRVEELLERSPRPFSLHCPMLRATRREGRDELRSSDGARKKGREIEPETVATQSRISDSLSARQCRQGSCLRGEVKSA